MSGKQGVGFNAEFTYTPAVLDDFEAMYLQKKEVSPVARIVLGVIGAAGAIYIGWLIYQEGFQIVRVGYLIICSLMMLVALSRGKKRPDQTIQKYRKYYTDRKAAFRIDESGVEMHLEGQKNYARSKFKEIYGLFDTDLCLYFIIKGRAYYIIPRDGVADGAADELMRYMQKKCAKRFLHYDVNKA